MSEVRLPSRARFWFSGEHYVVRSAFEEPAEGSTSLSDPETRELLRRLARLEPATLRRVTTQARLPAMLTLSVLESRRLRIHRWIRPRIPVAYEPYEAVPLSELAGPEAEQAHWIGLALRDTDGTIISDEPCVLTFEDGRIRHTRTDDSGVVYIDRLDRGGDCWLSLPNLDADAWTAETAKEERVDEPVWHWRGVQFCDTDGYPLPGLGMTVDGADDSADQATDAQGRIWHEGEGEGADVRLTPHAAPASGWVMLRLEDTNGKPISDFGLISAGTRTDGPLRTGADGSVAIEVPPGAEAWRLQPQLTGRTPDDG